MPALNSRTKFRHIVEHVLGLAIFFSFLAWFYRVPPWMWTTHLPQYGDVLEALWQVDFWRTAVLSGRLDPVSFAAMWPIGTHMFSIAHNGVSLLLLVFSIPFGSTAAVNLGFVTSYLMSFAGLKLLLQRFTPSPLLTSVGATLATFALGRTAANHWLLHVSLAAAFGTWAMLLAVALSSPTNLRSQMVQALLLGMCWGIAAILQPYLVFLAAVVMLIPLQRKGALKFVLMATVTAALVSLPYLLMLRHAQHYMSSLPPNLRAITFIVNEAPVMQASLSSVVGWYLTAWRELTTLTGRTLRIFVPGAEVLSQNWGLLIWVFTFLGAVVALRERSALKLSILSLLVVAFLLALGPFWVNPPFHSELIVSINRALWHLGQTIKPSLFDHWSSDLTNTALPLPALPLYMFVPHYEMARVPGRYLIIVGFCAVILSVVFLSKLPKLWQVALSAVWLLELLPMPTQLLPAPDAPHPAHVWFARRFGTSAGVLSPAGTMWVYSSYLAGVKSTSTIGSFMPEYALYTVPWIRFSHDPYRIDDATLANPDLVNILVRAQVSAVLLSPEESKAAMRNEKLRFVQCFPPEPGKRFDYANTTLCAFEVVKSPTEVDINVQPRRGFSGFEIGLDKSDQLIWVVGREAEAGWWLSEVDDYELELRLRAFCPPNMGQRAEVLVNGHRVSELSWVGECWEARHASAPLPRSVLREGWNSIVIKAAHAARPQDYVEGSTDSRHLSVAVERLHLRRSSPLE